MSDAYDRRFPKVTDRALDELRKRIDVKIENTLEPWCNEATRDNIRHYAHGIGDDNPLWCDPTYAKGTTFGDVVALPSFLFACSRIISGYVGGLPGVHASDKRKIEIVAKHLPLYRGLPLVLDATIVSPLRANGQPRPRAAVIDGVAITAIENDKHTKYPELINYSGANSSFLPAKVGEGGVPLAASSAEVSPG